jgi:hypothetical protein
VLVTGRAGAQSTAADVTFAVPLNLTNLSTDVTKVRVWCWFIYGTYQNQSARRSGELEIPVTARQVVTTAQVVVLLPAISPSSVGQSQNYTCELSLYSPSLGWSGGSQFSSTEQSGSFKTTQPVPSRNSGQFQW